MFRRSALASLFLVAIFASNALAAGKTVSVSASAYSPASVTVAMGGTVAWKNATAKKHTVTSSATFLWSQITVKAHKTSKALAFDEAGSFSYYDSLHAGLKGTVVVPMTASAVVISVGSSVTLTLGTAQPSGPVWHQVQERVNGGAWSLVATTELTFTGVKLSSAGTYDFETRLHQALGAGDTGWSPVVTVTAE